MTLGVSVVALLAALGAGSALLPENLTGPGTPAEMPAAAVAALAPGAGGGVPGGGAATRPAGPAGPAGSEAPSSAPAAPSSAAAPSKPAAPKPTKTTKKPTPPKPTVAPGLAGQETEVIRLVNVERAKNNCGAVKLNTKLRTAMRLHVEELGRHGDLYISHVSDDGRSFVDRAKAQGYNDPGGENVARGQQNAADVMNSWMNSEGHRANILNCDFKAIGVGVAEGVDNTLVWGQIFGRS